MTRFFCAKTLLRLIYIIFSVASLLFSFGVLIVYFYSFNWLHQIVGPEIVEQQLFGSTFSVYDIPAIYNSDLIQPYLIVQDAYNNLGALQEWGYSPALYIFPDWLISLLLIILGVENRLLPIFYGAIIFTLYSICIGMVVSKCLQSTLWKSIWLATIVIMGYGGLILLCPQSALSYYMMLWLGSAYIHSGAVLLCLIATFFWISLFYPQTKTAALWSAVLLCGSIFLISLSDFIFVIWFVAPAVSVTFIYQWVAKKYTFRHYFFLIAPSFLAIMLETIIRQQSPESRAHHSGSIALWFSDLLTFINNADYPILIILFFNGVLFLRGCFIFYGLHKTRSIDLVRLLELLLAAITLFSIAVPLLMNLYRGYALWRYFLIINMLPFAWLTLLLSQLVGSKLSSRLLFGTPVLLLVVASLAYPMASAKLNALRQPSELESCLIDNGLLAGYGDYWHAKALIFLTNRDVHIAQLTLDAKAYTFNFNRSWFHKRADGSGVFEPRFIIMSGLNQDSVEQEFGRPDSKILCQNKLIWRYDHVLSSPNAYWP